MMRKVCFGLILTWMAAHAAWAQTTPAVFINELHNEAGQNDEWTEFVVAQDNLSLVGYFFSDNNAGTDTWRPKKRFKNVALWQHVRAGTYILIRHSNLDPCNNSRDTDAADGFLDICVNDTRYFDGGDNTTMFLSSDGDFVQIVDPSGAMVHGLGFDPDPGSSVRGGSCSDSRPTQWRNITNPVGGNRPCDKFLFLEQTLGFESLFYTDSSLSRLVPNLGQFIATAGPTQLLNTGAATLGHGNTDKNVLLMRRLRQPAWPNPSIACVTSTLEANTFTIDLAPDPYQADQTLKYVIVRYEGAPPALDALPADGQAYALGQSVGSGTVVYNGVLAASSYSDSYNGVNPNNTYRIFAYRYTTTPGETAADRGPAYNETQYATAAPGRSLQLTGPATLCQGDTATFVTDYTGQLNIDYTVEPAVQNVVTRSDGATLQVWLTGPVTQGQAIRITASIAGPTGPCQQPGTGTLTFRTPTLSVSPDTTVAYGQPAQVRVVANDTVTITPRDSLFRLSGILYEYRDSVSKTFRFRVGQGNCGQEVTWRVTVLPKPGAVYVPNIVIKSGKDDNQRFVIRGAVAANLTIYSRWGHEVYTADEYANDWASETPGLFFFTADLALPSGEIQKAKGWIEVID